MAFQTVYNSFQYGMVDEVFRRRTDLQFAQNSASRLINAVPLRTGGLRNREGCVEYAELANDVVRIIAFTTSVDDNIIIALAPNKLYVYKKNPLKKIYANATQGDVFETPYTKSEIEELQFAQTPNTMIFAHWNHPPMVFTKHEKAYNFVEIGTLLEVRTNKPGDSYDYKGLFTEPDQFPSCVAFCNQRLMFCGTKKSPYGIWLSRPFEHFNFQEVDKYATVDDKATTDQYLKAIEGSKITSVTDEEGNTIKTNTVVSPDGYVIITESKFNKEGVLLEEKKKTYNYMESVEKWGEVQREDCAIHLELGGPRDEHICWACSLGSYLMIGTVSSEMVMPANISATRLGSYTPTSFYGSVQGKQCAFGDNMVFFIQSGSKKIRSISYGYSEGGASNDMTFLCCDILKPGIKEICWQRVQEPRLYAVLKDGTIATLTYDRQSGVNAWCLWNSIHKFESLAIVDTHEGQSVYAIVNTGEKKVLAQFEEGVYTDLGAPIEVRVITNNLDNIQSIPYSKKIEHVYMDTNGCGVKVFQEGNSLRCTTREQDKDLFEIIPYSTSRKDKVRLIIENEAGMPFYLFYLAVMLEVG